MTTEVIYGTPNGIVVKVQPAGAPGPQGVAGPTGPTGAAGPAGPANTLSIGTVTTGSPGSSAAATITGTAPTQTLNLTIPTGQTGPTGAAATVQVGTVTTGAAGSSAAVSNSGTTAAAVFNFTIPRGDTGATGAAGTPGAAATVAVGTVTTGAPASDVTVTNSGTSSAAVLNFSIPRGTSYYQDGVSQVVASGTVNAGGWYVPPSLHAAMTLQRVYARVLSGSGSEFYLTIKRNTAIVYGPTRVLDGSPVTETVNLAFSAGDAVLAEISDVVGVTGYVVQLNGVF